MATENYVNIGSGNGLVPDDTKPLPEPVLTGNIKGILMHADGQAPAHTRAPARVKFAFRAYAEREQFKVMDGYLA